MNAPKRLKFRLPLKVSDTFTHTDIIPVFHRWIQENSVPGLLIDVADYKHVPNGPGILLIGDEGDYNLDQIDGEYGLVYDRKRQTGDNLGKSVRTVVEHITRAVQKLEAEEGLGITIAEKTGELTLLDRLQYPNRLETFDQVRQTVASEVESSFGASATRLTYGISDPRRPLSIRINLEPEPVFA